MPKLAIVGNLEIAPGHLDRVLPLLMAHRATCLVALSGGAAASGGASEYHSVL